MAVESLLAAAPITITSQIVESTNQRIKQVSKEIGTITLAGEVEADQSAFLPGSKPVGSALPSSEDNGFGQGSSDGNEAEGGNTTSTRGNAVNTSA